MADTSNLYRALSAVFLINSAAFSKATVPQQTETLMKTEGKPVVFVENFVKFSDRRALRDGLLAGKDVSTELEFNGIDLTREEQAALVAVRPVLEKISGLKGGYPWVGGEAAAFKVSGSSIRFNSKYSNHSIGLKTAKKIWDRASAFWAGAIAAPGSHYESASGYSSRLVEYSPSHVKIGCQTISRVDVEAVALNQGWEPNIA